MNEPILQGIDLHFSYPGAELPSLRGVNFSIYPGQRVALLGQNGSGKSTLLLHLNAVLRPNRGEVHFKGQPLGYHQAGLKALRAQVGLVFQNPDDQLFSANVRQDLSFGPLNLGLERNEVKHRIEWAADATGITQLLDRPIHALSYGQRMRVAIAGVLAMRPTLLIADEPTSSLDPQMAAQVMAILNELQRQGTTILLATHDVDLAYGWADQVIVLDDGRVEASGSPCTVLSDEQFLGRVHLAMPGVLQVWRALVARGIHTRCAFAPRTFAELAFAISGDGEEELSAWLLKIEVGVEA